MADKMQLNIILAVVLISSLEFLPGADGAPELRPWSLAYGFTTKATKTKKKLWGNRDDLIPNVKDIPGVSDMMEGVSWITETGKAREVDSRINLSKVPKSGCLITGNSAVCRVPVKVHKNGFDFEADVAVALRYSTVRKNETGELSEVLFVNNTISWKGEMPATKPGMCFFLRKVEATANAAKGKPAIPPGIQVVAIKPGPEEKRRLPMELALRFDNLSANPRAVSGRLRLECKANGETVENINIGRFKIETILLP